MRSLPKALTSVTSVSLLSAVTLGTLLPFLNPSAARALEYDWCSAEIVTAPSQDITDRLAAYINQLGYSSDMDNLESLCFGRLDGEKTWVYRGNMKSGKHVDIAVQTGGSTGLEAAINDADGWGKWEPF